MPPTWQRLAPPSTPAVFTVFLHTGNLIAVKWQDVPDETGFQIQRRVSGTSIWSPLANPLPGVTTYLDASAAAGTSYDYRLSAVNSSSPDWKTASMI